MRFLSDQFFDATPEIYRANADAAGLLAGVTLTAPTATASGSGSPAAASGAPASIVISAATGSASSTASPGNASGTPASISLSAPTATAVGSVFVMPTSPSPFVADVQEDSIAIRATWRKQPADAQDYDISYVEYLTELADTATGVVVTAEDGINILGYSLTAGVVKVLLNGGADGMKYKVTITLATAGSRIKQAEFKIRVKET